MHFKARLTFTGPMAEAPYVKGAQMFLLSDPTIDFKYRGPPAKEFALKLKRVLKVFIRGKMSYPNLLALPLDPKAEPRDVYPMCTTGEAKAV